MFCGADFFGKSKTTYPMEASMKKFRPLYLLLILVLACFGFAAAACGPENKPPVEKPQAGEEAGSYYHVSASGVEHTLTLGGERLVTYSVPGAAGRFGAYTLENGVFRFVFSDGKENEGSIENNVITFKDGESNLRFVKSIPYTVTFDSNGGSAVATISVINGKTVAEPAAPSRPDYEFIGWYKDTSFTEPFGFGVDNVTENVTLYARWVKPVFGQIEYTIEFDANYPSDVTSEAPEIENIQTAGGKAVNLPNLTLAGYEFKGWWVSQYDDGAKLSYKLTETVEVKENLKAYALWVAPQERGTLKSPIVDVNATGLTWELVVGAHAYKVNIDGPEGFTDVANASASGTKYDVNFSNAPAGEYVIEVVAVSQGSDADSVKTVRYYKNKLLARVSKFQVIEPSTLVFNRIDGAENYTLKVECGDVYHKHDALDLGQSSRYNFANCIMPEQGGIKFTVTASAAGKQRSVSVVYAYARPLDKVTGLVYDKDNERIAWNAVANALGYKVKLSCDNSEHNHGAAVLVGDECAYSVKSVKPCAALKVEVVPVTKNYTSPEAVSVVIDKKTLSSPVNLRIKGDELSWSAVEGATSYVVYVNDEPKTVDTNKYDLTSDGELSNVENYNIYVKAKSANNESLVSDAVDARYYVLEKSLKYSNGILSWKHVIGVNNYEISLNGTVIKTVADGNNCHTPITFDSEGVNVISVEFIDGNANRSEAATIEVKAYKVTLYMNGGAIGNDARDRILFFAVGDKMDLPAEDMVRDGYDFGGWYNSSYGGEGLGARFVDEYFSEPRNIELYAYWVQRPLAVKLNYNYGASFTGEVTGPTSAQVFYQKSYTLPVPTPADSSFVFTGWCQSADGSGVFTDPNGVGLGVWSISRGAELYAGWMSAFEFELLPSRTYRIKKNISNYSKYPAVITLPTHYKGPKDAAPLLISEIGSSSFTSVNNVKTMRIPDSITYIDVAGFNYSSSLAKFEVYPTGNKIPNYFSDDQGVLYNIVRDDAGMITDKKIHIYPVARTGAYRVADGVTKISYNATYKELYASPITKLIVPSSVTLIDKQALYNCAKLEEIVFEFAGNVGSGSSVKSLVIKDEAFYSCTMLKKVTFPARMASFNGKAFYQCANLAAVDVEPASTQYSAVGGLLYSGDKRKVLFCPQASTAVDADGRYTLPTRTYSVGEGAFAGNLKIKKLTLPFWTQSIEKNAFGKCTNLEEVIFDDGDGVGATSNQTIGESAFEGCSKLTTITFKAKSSVTSIGASAFKNCYYSTVANAEFGLRSIALPNSLNTIEESAFEGCRQLSSLTIPGSVSKIGKNAFATCTSLVGITFQAAVGSTELSIEDYAFSGCSKLSELSLPKHVTHFGGGVLSSCPAVSKITVDAENKNYASDAAGIMYEKDAAATSGTVYKGIVYYPAAKKGAYEMPEYCTSIAPRLFAGNTGLTKITIGANVKEIGEEAFMNCSSLTEVVFSAPAANATPAPLTIGAKAFEYCQALIAINLPDRLRVLPHSLFYGDGSLRYNTYDSTSRTGTAFTLPQYLTEIGAHVFYNCNGLTSLNIPATVSKIGYQAFAYNSGIKTIVFNDIPAGTSTLPAGVTYAKDIELGTSNPRTTSTTANYYVNTFLSCSSLSSVTLPKHLTKIDNGMFTSCSSLPAIHIPSSILYIGAKAFYACSSLKNVTFDEEVKTEQKDDKTVIKNPLSFDYTSSINVSKPSSSYAPFYRCLALDKMELPARVENITGYTFYYAGLKEITLPSSLKTVRKEVKNSEGQVTSVSYVHAIQDYAFYNCTKLERVKFDDNNNQITFGTYAFAYCSELVNLELPKNIAPTADKDNCVSDVYDVFGSKYVFSGCTKLNNITVAAGSKYKARDGVLYYDGTIRARVTTKDASGKATEEIKDDVYVYEAVFCPVGNDKDVVIPYGVRSINSRAFTSAKLVKSISFEATPTGTTEVDLVIKDGDGSTQSYGAFYSMTISSLDLPNRLTRIGDYAFNTCEKLVTVTIDPQNSKLTYIGESAFEYCEALVGKSETVSGVTTAAFDIPKLVTTIGDSAFEECKKLKAVRFADGSANAKLTEIGERAFAATALSKITIPESVTDIGAAAFADTKLTEIVLPSGIESFGGLLSGVIGTPAVKFANNKSDYYEFKGEVLYSKPDASGNVKLMLYRASTPVDSFTVPSEVVYKNSKNEDVKGKVVGIAADAFAGNVHLKSVTIPKTVTSIEGGAFNGCTALETVTFEEDDANTKLNALSIGSSTDAVGVFQDCSNLSTVIFPERIATLGKYVFQSCLELDDLRFPKAPKSCAYTEVAPYTFTNAGGGTLELPDTVVTLSTYSFYQSSFREVKANKLRELKDKVFYKSQLERIVLPETLEKINCDCLFESCARLEEVEFKLNANTPLVFTGYLSSAFAPFYSCTKLKKVTIASNGKVPNYLFTNCSSLEEINFLGSPEFVAGSTTKGQGIGNGIPSLKRASVSATAKSIETYAFYNSINLGTHNPDTCVDPDCEGDSEHSFTLVPPPSGKLAAIAGIGEYAFYKTGIKSFEIPGSAKSLGANAFALNTALTSVTIPSETTGLSKIGNNAFDGCTSLSSVTFSKNATSSARKLIEIGTNAFRDCTSLSSIDLTGFTVLGDFAFARAGLTSVEIPKTIGDAGQWTSSAEGSVGVFVGCEKLASVKIPTNGTFTRIPGELFRDCIAISSVELVKSGSGANKLVAIGKRAFENTPALKSITLHDGLQTIGDSAFKNSGLNTVALSSSIGSISDSAFEGCAIATLTISGTYARYGLLSNCVVDDADTLVRYFGTAEKFVVPVQIKKIGAYAFNGSTVKEVDLSSNTAIEVIGDYAFAGNKTLTTITLGNAVKSIGDYAFDGCVQLGGITLPDTVSEVGDYAFSGCENLAAATLGSGVKKLGEGAFKDCKKLENIAFPAALESIGGSSFESCSKLAAATFAQNSALTAIGKQAFSGCEKLASIAFPSKLESIGDGAFFGCATLSAINIPVNVKAIGKAAFAKCANVNSLTFAGAASGSAAPLVITPGTSASTSDTDGVANYNRGAFSGLDITTVDLHNRTVATGTITDGVVAVGEIGTLGAYAFEGCEKLVSYTLPQNAEKLDGYTFMNCKVLSTPDLSGTLAYIGTAAFMDCVAITSLEIPANISYIGAAAFAGCTELGALTFAKKSDTELGGPLAIANGSSVTSKTSRGAFSGTKLSTVDFTNRAELNTSDKFTANTKQLGNYIFADCASLTSVTLPETVEIIGTAAFMNSGLQSYTVPAHIKVINNAAFAGCTSLAHLEFASGGDLAILNGTAFKNADPKIRTSDGSRGAFADCTALTGPIDFSPRRLFNATTFAGSAQVLAAYILAGSKVEKFVLPDNVTGIGTYAFAKCTGLGAVGKEGDNVSLLKNVSDIDIGAFAGSSISSLVVPAAVLTIRPTAFAVCKSLTSVSFEAGNRLNLLSGTTTYYTEEGVITSNYAGVFAHSGVAGKVDLSKRTEIFASETGTTTTLGTNAFAYCAGLTEIVLPASTAQIYGGAFRGTGIRSFTVPANITSIGSGAFAECKSLTTLTLVEAPTTTLTMSGGSSSSTTGTRGAFAGCVELTSVDLSKRDMPYVDSFVFEGCTKLKNITLPDSVTDIGPAAFMDTAIESFVVKDNITEIGYGAFAGTQLASLTFEPTNELSLGAGSSDTGDKRGVFAGTKITTVDLTPVATLKCESYYDALVAPYLFNGCKELTTVKIPNVMWLGIGYSSSGVSTGYSFAGCEKLTTVEWPTSVKFRIGDFSFAGCDIKAVDLPSNAIAIGYGAFKDNKNLATADLSKCTEITTINGFTGCEKLTTVKLHDKVEDFGNDAFKNCTKLEVKAANGDTGVYISDNIESIGKYAFYGCKFDGVGNLGDKITTPSKLTYIGEFAYGGNSVITEVDFLHSDKLTTINGFGGCTSLNKVTFNAAATAIGENAFKGCTLLGDVTLTDKITVIGAYAFYNTGASGNSGVFTVSDKIKSLGAFAYGGNAGITSVSFANNSLITSVNGFGDCVNLASVTFNSEVNTAIGANAFKNCTSLDSIVIPTGIKLIGEDAFKGCTNLASIVTSSTGAALVNVEEIGASAFEGCDKLTAIAFSDKLITVGASAFKDCGELATITLGDGVNTIGASAFERCEKLSSIALGKALTGIGEYAFKGCTSLTSIVIPDTVTKLGNYVFEGWGNTQTINVVAKSAPSAWSTYWNYKSKKVDKTPNETDESKKVYEIQPDGEIAANVVYGYKVQAA